MMPVRPYRPHPRHLGLFIVVYVLGCGFAQALAIVPGTGISIWAPSGLFIATLVLVPRQSWPWWVLAGCFAELLSNVLWFHSPLPAAFLIYVGNALEAVVGALLVNWTLKRSIRLETLQEVLAFVVLCAGVAPGHYEIADQGSAQGISSFFRKPFDAPALLIAISEACENRDGG